MDNNEFGIKFDFPTSWRHGRGIASQIGKMVHQLGCNSPLLLTDKFLLSSGLVNPVIKSLERENIPYIICDDVNMEPTVDFFESLVNELDLQSYDAIIAVGGGSVIDVSKGLALIAAFGGSIRDYDGFDKVPGRPNMKVIAVPTTSGTGSEVSDGVILIDQARGTKFLVLSKKICPTVAITDPELTKSMPPLVTACSGVDALVHAIESYISKNANMASELFALKAIGLLSKGLLPAYLDGDDMDVRENMQIGATMAMMAAMNSYLGLCHAMAMPLCALYNMPHGQACGMMLPYVLRYNSLAVEEKIRDIFQVMGFVDKNQGMGSSIENGYQGLEQLLNELGISAKLSDFKYKESHLDIIVKETMGSAQRFTNPRNPAEKDIADLVKQVI